MNIINYLKQSSIYNVLSVESLYSAEFRKKLAFISKIIIFAVAFAILFLYFTKNSVKFAGYRYFFSTYNLISRGAGLILFNVGVYLWSQITNFYLSSTYYFEKITKNKYTKD